MIRNIKQFLFIAGLLLIAAGAQPVGAAIWSWSTTASTNATADASINWAEGMAPSAVNDSARAMMAVLAAWRNDISATNTTTGTATAYALATSEGVNTTPANGQMLSFIAHANNGTSPTLQADGGNTYPLWMNGGAIGSGTLLAGSPYRVAFSVANSAWLLEAGYGNSGTPLGGILWSTAPTAPSSNFVAPSGQCISTTTYAAYWVQQGSPASGACPGGQFAIIDMRGRVAAALDTLNASAANRMTAAGCGAVFNTIGTVCTAGETQTLITANLPAYTPAGSISVNSTLSDFVRGTLAGFSATSGASVFQAGATLSSLASVTVTSTGSLSGTAQGGTSTPFSKVQPTIGLIPYLRIL